MAETRDSILLIDDDEQIVDVLSLVLESDGFEVHSTATPDQALQILAREKISLILLDLRLGDYNGLELFPRLREAAPNLPIFIITAHGDVDSAVDAFTLGATGYIRKPFKEGDLRRQISEAVETYRLRSEIQAPAATAPETDPRSLIRTRDPAMEPVLRRISTAARVSSNVVILGESGTGKELAARALHLCGPRKDGPFVAINCAAMPENLLESELFGYVKGAFTDARENRAGLIVRASGGTLFLDEIGDSPLSIQTKLLRVLQEREVRPIGASEPVRVDVRVVSATHKSLQEEVAAGRFRQDLFYRLHVIPIQIPALRERPKDIPFLGAWIGARIAAELQLSFDGFTPAAEAELRRHAWPGNVRELQNRLEQALAITGGGRLPARALFPELPETSEETEQASAETESLPTFFEAKHSFERSYLERVLSAARGNIARAARLASKSRTEVYNLLRKHSLDPGAFKDPGGDSSPRSES